MPVTEMRAAASSPAPSWALQESKGRLCLALKGTWNIQTQNGINFPQDSFASVASIADKTVTVDVTGLQNWDVSLIAFLWDVKKAACQASLTLDEQTLPDSAQRLLALLPDKPAEVTPHQEHHEGFLSRVGGKCLNNLNEIGTMATLTMDVFRGAMQAFRGKSAMRLKDLLVDVWNAGPSALLIVSIVNFLVGAILAFVGLIELRKFAAEIYVTNLVGIASAREISAIMTAIIMAGRTGGAYAARISTMLGNEEIDALQVTGIPVSGYILLPSILSLVIMMPLLYLYGTMVSIFGGFVVAMGMMDISPIGYWLATFDGVEISQFVFGFIKSLFFAAFIALAACRVGLKAGRSAADVGIAATRAVVIGIVGIIALDAVFAVIANAVGI
ncbi:ABC transporter permease [Bombella sp. ESL0378]|uniref:MlaE family ABC transporter permease n=1 Tax=Bombella sp. ESL0378 TaxID=2676442 RepID=UPI0012D97777|nr:ABC transporter permease [Bombella sp. ESL0378]MUG05527.1 ABC transporter permease [Bombella sp. ESL0378]